MRLTDPFGKRGKPDGIAFGLMLFSLGTVILSTLLPDPLTRALAVFFNLLAAGINGANFARSLLGDERRKPCD